MAAREMGTYINRCCERSHATAASLQIRPRCARLLAKPQYFSPPDEVCCWLGRRGRARAQPWRSAIGKMLLAVAPPMRSLLAREPPAQRTAGRDVVAELLLAGNHRHRGLLAGTPMRLLPGRDAGTEQGRRQCTGAAAEPAGRLAGALLWSEGADNTQASPRSTSGQQSASAAAGQWRWQKARAGAGRQILSDSPSDLAITSAAQVLPYVFTAVRGISQSC